MSVLSTFVYLFEGDTKPLEEAQAGAERDTKRLRAELDKTDDKAAKLGQTFLGFAKAAGAGIAAALSAGAILALVDNVTASNDALGDQAAAIGVSVEALSLWDSAAEMSGGQAGAFTASLGAFNERMQEAARVGKGPVVDMLASLGVGLDTLKAKADDPIGVMTELSDKLSELSAAEAAGIGRKLGLDPGTITLLREGRAGVEGMLAAQRELGFVTAADVEASAAYRDALDRMNKMWEQVRRRIVLFVVPALTWLADKWGSVAKLIDENSTLVAIGIGVVALALLGVLLPALASAAVAAWALIAPFLPLIAAIVGVGAAIALVAEDLYQFQSGNDSLIGELAKKWPWIGELIRGVGQVLAWLIATVFGAADAIGALFAGGPQAALKSLRDSMGFLASDIEGAYPLFEGLADVVTTGFDLASVAVDYLGEIAKSVFAMLTGNADGVSDRLGRLGTVYRALAEGMRSTINGVSSAWQTLLAIIEAVVGRVSSTIGLARAAGSAVGRLFGRGGSDEAGPSPERAAAAVAVARPALAAATTSNVGATSSSAVLAGATNNRSTSVNVGTVEVNTQATDAAGIASGIGSELGRQLNSAADQADDGVLA